VLLAALTAYYFCHVLQLLTVLSLLQFQSHNVIEWWLELASEWGSDHSVSRCTSRCISSSSTLHNIVTAPALNAANNRAIPTLLRSGRPLPCLFSIRPKWLPSYIERSIPEESYTGGLKIHNCKWRLLFLDEEVSTTGTSTNNKSSTGSSGSSGAAAASPVVQCFRTVKRAEFVSRWVSWQCCLYVSYVSYVRIQAEPCSECCEAA
jgi:hypothetical protein